MTKSTVEIQNWLTEYISALLQEEIESEGVAEVDVTTPFDRLGLDSATAVDLVYQLEEWLGIEVDPRLPYEYPTIESLAQKLSQDCEQQSISSEE